MEYTIIFPEYVRPNKALIIHEYIKNFNNWSVSDCLRFDKLCGEINFELPHFKA